MSKTPDKATARALRLARKVSAAMDKARETTLAHARAATLDERRAHHVAGDAARRAAAGVLANAEARDLGYAGDARFNEDGTAFRARS